MRLGRRIADGGSERRQAKKTRNGQLQTRESVLYSYRKRQRLTKQGGRVSMIQSASSLLFNRSGPACDFRKKFFTTFRVGGGRQSFRVRFKVFNQKTDQLRIGSTIVYRYFCSQVSNGDFSYISPKAGRDFARNSMS